MKSDREAIETLIAEFAWLLDHGEPERIPLLFTENGRLRSAGQLFEGQEQLKAACKQRTSLTHTSRHIYTNLRLVFESPSRYSGTVMLTAYRHDGDGLGSPTPTLVADSNDIYEQDEQGNWFFAERSVLPVFASSSVLDRL